VTTTERDTGDTALLVPVPAGWVELAAFEDDASATAWFDRLLDDTPGLDEISRAHLHDVHRRLRSALAGRSFDAAGAMLAVRQDREPSYDDTGRLTLTDDDLTVWVFLLQQVVLPGTSDLDPVAVIEAYVGSEARAEAELVESFTTADGRSGLALHGRAAAYDVDLAPLTAAGLEPDDPGVVQAVMHLGALPDHSNRVLVTTGLCPTFADRPVMALAQAHLTIGARPWRRGDDLPEGTVVLDATGLLHDQGMDRGREQR
jgi:hypothetical protein